VLPASTEHDTVTKTAAGPTITAQGQTFTTREVQTVTSVKPTTILSTGDPLTVTATEQSVLITTAQAQTVTMTMPLTIRPPADTVTASTAFTVTVVSMAPASTISLTETVCQTPERWRLLSFRTSGSSCA
jgi:hypothetical protein